MIEHTTGNMQIAKNAIISAVSLVGAGVTSALGGWDTAMQTLIIFMGADYICGLIVAGIFHRSPKTTEGKLESRAGLKGLFRKIGILVAVIIATYLDMLLGESAFARTATIMFFIANEGLSIVENLALMGIPFPMTVLKALEQINPERMDTKTEEEE